MTDYTLKWRPAGPVSAAFVKHRAYEKDEQGHPLTPIETLRGPIGGGKSVTCAMKAFTLMAHQQPGPDGYRRSRGAVIRNTNPELEMTTIKTWLEWFPEEHFGRMRWAKPFVHHFRFEPLKIDSEVWFFPCDDEGAVKKLLSLELSWAWANEFREIPREVLIALRSRCNRYPSRREGGVGTTYPVLMGDTNSPDVDHYLAWWEGKSEPPEWFDEATRKQLFQPRGVHTFVQPGGLLPIRQGKRIVGWRENPAAENLQHLPPGYYTSQVPGNTTRWLQTMCGNEFGPIGDVRTVYEDFDAATHKAEAPIQYEPDAGPIVLGMDFARNPAVLFGQEVNGQLRILREVIGQNVDVAAFVKQQVIPTLRQHFPPDVRYRGWGDPSGHNRTGGDDSTAFSHAREGGLVLLRGRTNDPDKRQKAVTRRLTTTHRGEPAILISPVCTTLLGGFQGGYRLEKVANSGTGASERYKDEPVKNLYSHVHDALQYLCDNHDAGAHRDDDDRRPAHMPKGALPNGRAHFDAFALARASRLGRR